MAYETEFDGALLQARYFSIDDESVIFKDTQMMCADITGFAYGAVVHRLNGIQTKTEHHLRFIDTSGDDITFNFVNPHDMNLRAEDVYERIISEIWTAFGNRIYNDTINTIASGGTVKVGETEFSQRGVLLKRKAFLGKMREAVVPWDQMDVELDRGALTLRDGREPKLFDIFSLGGTYNAHIILRLFQQIAADADLMNVMKGSR